MCDLLLEHKTKKCSTIHYFCSWTTLQVVKNTEHFQRKVLLSSSRNINVETIKENGIMLSQYAQNVVEARFLRNIAG